ncbi:MAG: hypothetical protein ABI867_28260 [Kofleriaceae bacterium]
MVLQRNINDQLLERRQRVSSSDTTFDLALPNAFTNVVPTWAESPAATWTLAEEWNQIFFAAHHTGALYAWDTLIDRSWVAAGGDATAVTIPDPNVIPGWDPSWSTLADRHNEFSWTLTVTEETEDSAHSTSASFPFPLSLQ